MKDWKTILCGIIAALAAFVVQAPQYFPPLAQDIASFILAGGLAGLGITAAQARRDGQQPKPRG